MEKVAPEMANTAAGSVSRLTLRVKQICVLWRCLEPPYRVIWDGGVFLQKVLNGLEGVYIKIQVLRGTLKAVKHGQLDRACREERAKVVHKNALCELADLSLCFAEFIAVHPLGDILALDPQGGKKGGYLSKGHRLKFVV